MNIFVSYTTINNDVNKWLLETLSKKLSKLGDIYIDLINNDSDDKQARVMYELNNCDVFILLETKNVYKSKWVNLEIETIKNKQISFIIVSDMKINALINRDIINNSRKRRIEKLHKISIIKRLVKNINLKHIAKSDFILAH